MRHAALVSRIVVISAVGMLAFGRIGLADDAPKLRAPGGAVTIGATASATVKAIDADKRIVTLQKEDGSTVDVQCGPHVRNFDQIKVGDQVKAAAIAQLVVAVGDSAAGGEESGAIIARRPMGAKPGAVIVNTEQIKAKIDAIDPAKRTVTLSGINEKPQTVEVASDVDLASVKPGDDVSLRVTKGIALWVEHPEDAQTATGTVKPEGMAAGFTVEGQTATATVDAVDPAKRIVTLKAADGSTRSIHLGERCVNFDQIKVGDQVRATLSDEVAISVRKAGGPASADTGTMVALAPKGAKPGILVADTDDVTGQIKSIDAQNNTITLSQPDGASRTFKAGSDVSLSDLKPGDNVTARVTQAMAIIVAKP